MELETPMLRILDILLAGIGSLSQRRVSFSRESRLQSSHAADHWHGSSASPIDDGNKLQCQRLKQAICQGQLSH